ncbi:MAG: tetratricopeptide repeat protein [Bacteroidetes bacterium]|jgi:tetratricopeptide (TPR) repeat protein|nr:tetratricopeptide repeat protein [Bacteroidota bacterium]
MIRWLLLLLPVAIAMGQSTNDANTLFRAGKVRDARTMLEQILDKDENNADAHYWMAAVLMHRDIRDLEGATDHIEEAIEHNPNNADYQFLLGGVYGQTAQSAGVFKQAFLAPKIKRAFLRAVELNPEHVDARIALAQYYLMAPGIMGGDDDEGFRQLDEVVKRNELRGRMAKAAMLERKKQTVDAENEWKALTTKYPDQWIPQKNFGYFLLRHQRADEALKPMGRYLDLRPDTSDAFDSYGEVLLAAGRVDEAITTLKKGLALEPTLGSSWFLLGQAYEKQQRMSDAKEAYQRVVQYDRNEQRKKQAGERLEALP